MKEQMAQAVHQHESPVGMAAKIGSAWALVGITSWADFASALAAFYTLMLICEWLWKRLLRPFCERRGWLQRRMRRRDDRRE